MFVRLSGSLIYFMCVCVCVEHTRVCWYRVVFESDFTRSPFECHTDSRIKQPIGID